MDAAPNPCPMIAVAVISVGEDGASFIASTSIRGTDLDLCDVKAGVKAEVRGWPCVVTASPMGSSELAVRVSAPTFNGEKLPDADAGGPSTFGWEPMILSCGGDFGDARIGVRLVARRVWVTAGGDDVEVDDVEDVTDAFREMDGGWIDFRPVSVEPPGLGLGIRRLLRSLGRGWPILAVYTRARRRLRGRDGRRRGRGRRDGARDAGYERERREAGVTRGVTEDRARRVGARGGTRSLMTRGGERARSARGSPSARRRRRERRSARLSGGTSREKGETRGEV